MSINSVVSESNKKDVGTDGPMFFFFKLFHQNYPILTPNTKSFLALMATSIRCESLFIKYESLQLGLVDRFIKTGSKLVF